MYLDSTLLRLGGSRDRLNITDSRSELDSYPIEADKICMLVGAYGKTNRQVRHLDQGDVQLMANCISKRVGTM